MSPARLALFLFNPGKNMVGKSGDRDLVRRVRAGDEAAWKLLISEYEGRLHAFAISRMQDHAQAEDLVQETLLGFLTALPNYDDSTPLESFLFAICSHKIIDTLRRQGRRPSLSGNHSAEGMLQESPDRRARGASSMARSREGHLQEELRIVACLQELIQVWQESGDYERLKCVELLLVKGLPNKDVAAVLNISEQAVANHKQYVVAKLKIAN